MSNDIEQPSVIRDFWAAHADLITFLLEPDRSDDLDWADSRAKLVRLARDFVNCASDARSDGFHPRLDGDVRGQVWLRPPMALRTTERGWDGCRQILTAAKMLQ